MRAALLLWILGACTDQDKAPAGDDSGGGTGAGDDGGGSGGSGGSGGGETGQPEASCVEGPRPVIAGELCVSEAGCTWTGEQSYEYYAWQLASGGDVDGDGVDDLLLGSPAWDAELSAGDGSDAGRVVLVSGAALAEPGDGVVATVTGSAYGQNLGMEVDIVGDVTGDGIADALVGAHGDDAVAENAGVAFLMAGAPGGWASGAVEDVAAAAFYGESTYARVGRSFAGVGDVDGDGVGDLAITGELATYDGEDEDFLPGRVYLMLGGADLGGRSLADADVKVDGEGEMGAAGRGLAGGDLDGDGYAEVAIGEPYGCSWDGCVYAMPGGATAAWGATLADATPIVTGDTNYDATGWTLAVDDWTGDGVADLAVGVPLSDRSYGAAGAVVTSVGGPELIAGAAAQTWVLGPWDDWQLGSGLVSGGDLTGDGVGDLLVGAVEGWTGLHTKAGRFYLLAGSSAGPPSDVGEAAAILHGGAVKDYLGNAAALGDLDADGHADAILASPYANAGSDYDIGAVYLFWGG